MPMCGPHEGHPVLQPHPAGDGLLHGATPPEADPKKLLAKIPQDRLDPEERALRDELADLPEITILQMIYQQMAYEGQAKDYEFSGTSMREHWDSGYADTRRTLRHRDWLAMAPEDGGVIVHDVHRIDD